MRKQTVGTASAIVLLLWSSTAAQMRRIGQTTETDRTVLSVLTRAGCNPGWLSQALDDSTLPMGELPPGKEIWLDAFSCLAEPSALVVKETAGFLKKPRAKSPATPAPKTVEVVEVKVEYAEPPPQQESVEKPAESKEAELGKVKLELEKTKQNLDDLSNRTCHDWGALGMVAGAGASFASFLTVLAMLYLQKRSARYRSRRRVESTADPRLLQKP